MTGDGALAEEERRRHLLIRATLGDELGHTTLRRGQTVNPGAATDATDFRASLLDPACSAELLEAADRRVDELTCAALLAGPPAHDAERELRTRSPVWISDALVLVERQLQELSRAR